MAITKASAITSRKSGRESRATSPGLLSYPKSIRTVGAVVRRSKSHVFTSIPTMNVYVNGEVVKTIVGAKPKPALLKELESFLA